MNKICEYCNSQYDDGLENCPHCGGQNRYIRRTDDTPKTIEELKQWYKNHNLPPETITRFFIGKNITEPKAFGIYFDDHSQEYVVYKNKDTGMRAVRYQGTDEAYAVNELYLRLKQEILNQKQHNASLSTHDKKPYSYAIKIWLAACAAGILLGIFDIDGFMIIIAIVMAYFVTAVTGHILRKHGKSFPKYKLPFKKTKQRSSQILILLLIALILFIPLHNTFTPKITYYNYQNEIYVSRGNAIDNYIETTKWYEYDYNSRDYNSIEYSYLPNDFKTNTSTYTWNYNTSDWKDDVTKFESSDFYKDNIRSNSNSDSDSSYDWSSSDTWDSGSTDWGSDW